MSAAPPLELKWLDPADLTPNPLNWREHPPTQAHALSASLETVGWAGAALFNRRTGRLVDGHLRREQAAARGELLPVLVGDWTPAQEAYILATLDPIAAAAGRNEVALDALLADLRHAVAGGELETDLSHLESLLADMGQPVAEYLPHLNGGGSVDPEAARQTLAERFGVPPFSVLDARQGYWQLRKRAWIALGIQSELGRGENALGLSPECEDYRDGDGDYSKSGAVVSNGPGGLVQRRAAARGYNSEKTSPGGSRRPACSLGPDGKTVRGDGKGRPAARAEGSGGPGTMDAQRREWREQDGPPRRLRDTPPVTGAAANETRSILAHNAAAVGKPTGTENRLSMGWTAHAYDAGGEGGAVSTSGTSIFDPVLCELAYRWFCPEGGAVLDPFAGGSVRGIVAAKLGRSYTGIDLSARQLQANREQAQALGVEPHWIAGDSRDAATLAPGEYDFLFSCPPYADLEVYSDDPRDLSTLDYPEFLAAYRAIIAAAVGMLRPDRFACFVVGDVRDPRGFYRSFVADTVAAFRDAGFLLYNDAVLVTAVGSLPIRVGKQFGSYRKLGKTHQNVLVFYRGDPQRIPDIAGDCEFGEFGEAEEIEAPELPAAPPPADTVRVKVSAAMARQQFHGCDPEYIRTTCHATCCESSSSPTGTLIAIHPYEEAGLAARGAVIQDGLLQPRPGERRCPFKTPVDLCGLHATGDKPFGCIASPFTLNASGTLVVRNRYRLLKCYKDGDLPAYRAFRASLELLFGADEAARIAAHLDGNGGDLYAEMPRRHYEMLRRNDAVKHAAGA